MAKITKREKFVRTAEVLRAAGEAELAEFAEAEVALIDKRAAKPRAATAAQKENAVLKAGIVEFLTETGEGVTATDVATVAEVSVQKASQLLRQLVAEGAVNRTEGKGKTKTLFSV